MTNINVETLVCPDDISAVDGKGNLSYVVNCGFGWTIPIDCPALLHVVNGSTMSISPLDFNGNGIVCPPVPSDDGPLSDKDYLLKTSLFFVEDWPSRHEARHHNLDSVVDGTGNTIMIMENVRAGYDPAGGSSWGAPEVQCNAFLLSGHVCEGGTCATGKVDYKRLNDHSDPVFRREALNASLDLPEGLAPWPSSLHGDIVHAVFCDGRVRPLSVSIDGGVYAALASPQGSTLRGPLAQQVVGDGEY